LLEYDAVTMRVPCGMQRWWSSWRIAASTSGTPVPVRPRGKRLGIAGRDADVAGSPYVSSPEGRNNLTEEVPSAELTHKVAGTLPPAGEDYLVTSMW
jgi:hypothetical protein